MLHNLDTIYFKPDLVRISQPKLISARTFFWFTEDGGGRRGRLRCLILRQVQREVLPHTDPRVKGRRRGNPGFLQLRGQSVCACIAGAAPTTATLRQCYGNTTVMLWQRYDNATAMQQCLGC